MLGLIKALARARAVRPLLAWVLTVLGFLVFSPPQEWVLLLIVGLGVALAMTIGRLRERRGEVREQTGRAWQLAERLAGAVEDRIRRDQEPAAPLYTPEQHYGHVPPGSPAFGQVPPSQAPYGHPVVAYDPGALLSGLVAVLAAEGLPTDPAPALLVAARMLADLGIAARPDVPAHTALGLVGRLPVGPPRRVRVLSSGLVACVVRVMLTYDGVLPAQISTDTAEMLTAHCAAVLMALGVQPGDAGSLADWPVIAQFIDAAPLPVPYEQWNR